ncbi:MAG: ZIP family metal transporter [Deltaproteobacteria bacterium]|jgi:ZIP family zinc transporter|nr:ZIP family metal transporter [Deltaproteobacteria bacterium]MBW2521355.1 ZIP family metal transporter [Deltaproteobacteria bacterium]
MSIVAAGLIASLAAGLATGAGALPALFFKNVPERLMNTLLGGAAGVMLAATSFSLIVPGITYGNELWPGYGVYAVAVGILLGALCLDLVNRVLPHEHFTLGLEGPSSKMRRIWLFIIAITIHNFPEGLAVGVGFGSGNMANGISLAIGIGLQNMPEGLAVALPLLGLGYSRTKAITIATLTGLVEPVGGLLGVAAVSIFYPVLPFGMAFAAGAMLFVISEEIIPETHARGRSRLATFGLVTGFVIMMSLDNLLG